MQPYPLYLIEGPSLPTVSLADMKQHLRVEHSNDDALIVTCVAACTQSIEGRDGWLGRALISQTWEQRLDEFPSGNSIDLRLPPLIEVEHVKYRDDDSVEQTLSSALYHVVGVGGARGRVQLLHGGSWPTLAAGYPEAVTVRFRAGYVDTNGSPTGELPYPIHSAIKLMAASLYEHREKIVIGQTPMKLPWADDELLSTYRVYW